MDKKLKARWIKALESGRYDQCQEALERNGAYCCLGVLRQVMHRGSTLQHSVMEMLSKEHQNEAGITWGNQRTLAALNDKGKSFKEIAAWIRKHL